MTTAQTPKPAPAKASAAPKAKASEAKPKAPAKGASGPSTLLAVVRLRGRFGLRPARIQTMEFLNLGRVHHCTLISATPSYKGMLQEAKDYITWGPVSAAVVEKMVVKRGCINGKLLREVKKPEEIKAIVAKIMAGESLKSVGIDRTFRLNSPSKGLEGIKHSRPYGDLGPRESMDELLKAMI